MTAISPFFLLAGPSRIVSSGIKLIFFLFPLYGRTELNGTTIRNFLWPIYADIKGENESGTKVWPLWGSSEKTGIYKKRFFLWPLFFKYDLKLDSENPEQFRTFFPFYVTSSSPKRSSAYFLWPFFGHVRDQEKGYEEWNYPWPLFRKVVGEDKKSSKYLPFYADEKGGEFRKRWFLWPIYKIEEVNASDYSRRRDRVLFFLVLQSGGKTPLGTLEKRRKELLSGRFSPMKKSRALRIFFSSPWPSPFFQKTRELPAYGDPCGGFIKHRYDEKRDIEISSFLWNFYWKERHAEDLAWEIFPLVRYRQEKGEKDFKLLKGLFRYSTSPQGKKVNFLFLPWGFSWDNQP